MTRSEAAQMLGLSETAAPDNVRARLAELHGEFQVRLTSAPTVALKRAYQQQIETLRDAVETLHPGLLDQPGHDFPALLPVDAQGVPGTSRAGSAMSPRGTRGLLDESGRARQSDGAGQRNRRWL